MRILTVAILSCGLWLLQSNVSVPARQKIVTASQVNGTWETKLGTFKLLALGNQRLKVEFSGMYPYTLANGTRMAHTGEGSGIAFIEGRSARFKPKGAVGSCLIKMEFKDKGLVVEQEQKQDGSCGFGHKVTAAGTYHKVSTGKPRFQEN